jgi:hypothetical protein
MQGRHQRIFTNKIKIPWQSVSVTTPKTAAVYLRFQRAALLEVLPHSAHGGHAAAEAGRDADGALAFVVKFEDALADDNGMAFMPIAYRSRLKHAARFMETL